jgi:hypothetical protein
MQTEGYLLAAAQLLFNEHLLALCPELYLKWGREGCNFRVIISCRRGDVVRAKERVTRMLKHCVYLFAFLLVREL